MFIDLIQVFGSIDATKYFFSNRTLDRRNDLPASAATSHTIAIFKQRLHSINFVHIYGILIFILIKVKLFNIYLFVYIIDTLCTSGTAEGIVSNLFMVFCLK
jgi:hypothetical protein